jgi:hypothetical protein
VDIRPTYEIGTFADTERGEGEREMRREEKSRDEGPTTKHHHILTRPRA